MDEGGEGGRVEGEEGEWRREGKEGKWMRECGGIRVGKRQGGGRKGESEGVGGIMKGKMCVVSLCTVLGGIWRIHY